MSEIAIGLMILALLACLYMLSRRIDLLHRRISLTTKLNGLRDPWRDAEDRAHEQG